VKVAIRAAAAADLEKIYYWIVKDSPANARAVVDRLLDAIETTIPAFPHIGRAGRIRATREWIVSGLPYIIVYAIDETPRRHYDYWCLPRCAESLITYPTRFESGFQAKRGNSVTYGVHFLDNFARRKFFQNFFCKNRGRP